VQGNLSWDESRFVKGHRDFEGRVSLFYFGNGRNGLRFAWFDHIDPDIEVLAKVEIINGFIIWMGHVDVPEVARVTTTFDPKDKVVREEED
jgi:hypothetical protein